MTFRRDSDEGAKAFRLLEGEKSSKAKCYGEMRVNSNLYWNDPCKKSQENHYGFINNPSSWFLPSFWVRSPSISTLWSPGFSQMKASLSELSVGFLRQKSASPERFGFFFAGACGLQRRLTEKNMKKQPRFWLKDLILRRGRIFEVPLLEPNKSRLEKVVGGQGKMPPTQ